MTNEEIRDGFMKYLAENINIEIDTYYQDCTDNQEITVRLKIGDAVISESSATIFIDT
jgi:hypothetical protein